MTRTQTGAASLPRYVTARQLAEMLQCCPQTVRNWCKRGLLPPPLVMGRRKRLWDPEAVRAALAKLQGAAGLDGLFRQA
jgi:hypothetical protein